MISNEIDDFNRQNKKNYIVKQESIQRKDSYSNLNVPLNYRDLEQLRSMADGQSDDEKTDSENESWSFNIKDFKLLCLIKENLGV